MTRHDHPLSRPLLALLLAGASAGASAAGGFPAALSENTTNGADSVYVGAPDNTYHGLGGDSVTYDFGNLVVVNRDGAVDLSVYEYDTSGVEFHRMTLLVSQDGVDFTSVKGSEAALVRIDGDGAQSASFSRSYDLGDLPWVRYVRVQGTDIGTGLNSGFDLDAIGAHELMAAVPEPSTWALLMAGACVVGSVARRRRQ